MSVARNLAKRLGGRWTWDNRASWHCDDGVRFVSRVSAGVDEYDNPLGPAQLWLYGDGVPRRAEEYAVTRVDLLWAVALGGSCTRPGKEERCALGYCPSDCKWIAPPTGAPTTKGDDRG